MKKLQKIVLLAAFLLLPVAIFAQGSGSTQPKEKPKEDNFAVTRSISGVLNSRSKSSITVKMKSGKKISLNLTKETRFVDSPKAGNKVKVTYLAEGRKATEVRKL